MIMGAFGQKKLIIFTIVTWKFDTCSIAFGQKQIFATTFFLYSKLEGDNGCRLAKETENICNNIHL